MKRRHVPVALLAVFLLAVLFYFFGGSRVPSGQPPLQRLTAENVTSIRDEFNAAKDEVRVVLLLSPT